MNERLKVIGLIAAGLAGLYLAEWYGTGKAPGAGCTEHTPKFGDADYSYPSPVYAPAPPVRKFVATKYDGSRWFCVFDVCYRSIEDCDAIRRERFARDPDDVPECTAMTRAACYSLTNVLTKKPERWCFNSMTTCGSAHAVRWQREHADWDGDGACAPTEE